MFFFKYRPGAHVEGLCGGGAKMGFINHFGGEGGLFFFWERGVGFVILKLKNYNNSALCECHLCAIPLFT